MFPEDATTRSALLNSFQILFGDWIIEAFSNFFVNDATTPINFVMETRQRTGSKTLLSYNPGLSSDTQIWFLPADTFWDTVVKVTALFYWTIDVEQVYTENPITIDVKELHDES